MSIVFCLLPEMLKPKVKETFPEITFLKIDDMDASQHGKKPRKKREKKVKTDSNDSVMPPLSAVCSD
jgi:predicted RNase H-like nuclease